MTDLDQSIRPAGRFGPASALGPVPDGYKWVALFISTLGMLMATIDGSITLIALPDIFRGIGINPLAAGNSFYLLWMILGFLVVTSVLVTSLGRLGDIYGRVRMYNLGFAVYTFFSLLLTITWMSGEAAGIWWIVMRIFQGVGAAMLMANSGAILTDAFPLGERGMAMGINQAAAFSGTFIGLVLGGILAPINWRLIFLVSVPIGLFATIWGSLKLREQSERRPARIDWPGNITFAIGLILVLVGITFGIEPYRNNTMGWTNPVVVLALTLGVVLLVVFGIIETKVPEPMSRIQLFKIRAFSAGVFASLLAALEPRRSSVHAHHLAAGDLAAPPRLRLRAHTVVGRSGHASAHGRVPARRAAVRNAVGPLRSPTVRHRRHARHGGDLFRVPLGAAAHRLPILALRRLALRHRIVHVLLWLAEPGWGHEQPSARAPGRRVGHEHHLPELRSSPVHRDLLHADDRGALRLAAREPVSRAGQPRRFASGGHHRLAPASGLDPVRRLLGLQPCPAPASGVTTCSPTSHSRTTNGASPAGASSPRSSRPHSGQGLHAALDFADRGQPVERQRLPGLGGRNPSPKW